MTTPLVVSIEHLVIKKILPCTSTFTVNVRIALSCTAGKHSCTYVLRDWMPVCIELTLDLHFKRGFFMSRCTYLEYS